jgi:hypothetical protein
MTLSELCTLNPEGLPMSRKAYNEEEFYIGYPLRLVSPYDDTWETPDLSWEDLTANDWYLLE